MPRRLRVQYPGAIYHIMACGNGRQDVVHDDRDRERLLSELARTVRRCCWQVDATNADLAATLGVSRPDSVPNLTRRFARWLCDRDEVRARLKLLEDQLRPDRSPPDEKTANLV